jgi:ABC-type bacteriocin/lantibiotic exporter with double-glycine peptidase domain
MWNRTSEIIVQLFFVLLLIEVISITNSLLLKIGLGAVILYIVVWQFRKKN